MAVRVHALRSGMLKSARNLVGHEVAQEIAKDECGGGLAVFPDGESRFEVWHVYLL
jgi:hypothetical protein